MKPGGLSVRRKVTNGTNEKDKAGIGDAYCFIGVERDTKLILAYHLGRRDANSTDAFIAKLSYATYSNRFQLASDGFQAYKTAVKIFLPGRVRFAQLVKVYGASREGE